MNQATNQKQVLVYKYLCGIRSAKNCISLIHFKNKHACMKSMLTLTTWLQLQILTKRFFSFSGCESEVRACHHRWAEITCKYPETNNTYQSTDVVLSNGTPVETSKKDVWEENGRFFLYHDTKNKNLKVTIKHVKEQEFGEYRCRFFQKSNSPDIQEGKLETGKKYHHHHHHPCVRHQTRHTQEIRIFD